MRCVSGQTIQIVLERRNAEVVAQLQTPIDAAGGGRQNFDDHQRIRDGHGIVGQPVATATQHGVGFVVAVANLDRHAVGEDLAW